MSRPVTEVSQLLHQLAAELEAVGMARPRSFDAGLVTAQMAVEDIANAFSIHGFTGSYEVSDALRDLEAVLAPGQGKPELDRARSLFRSLRANLMHSPIVTANLNRYVGYNTDASGQVKPELPSRRTRCVEDLSVRLLQPVHRERYREEWRAEILSLPRRDQAPHALRLLSRAWFMRRELRDKPTRSPRNAVLIIGVTIPGADAIAALCGLDWPAAVVGVCWTTGLMWIIASNERTQHLLSLIRAARSNKTPIRK